MSDAQKSNTNNDLGFFSKNAFFDWYGASIQDENVQKIADKCLSFFNGDFVDSKSKPPYQCTKKMIVGGEEVFTFSYGGVNPFPYIESQSDRSVEVADFIRSNFDHKVARCDIRLDFDEVGAFETLVILCEIIAKKYRLAVGHHGDWSCDVVDGKKVYTGTTGRTLNIGSRNSVIFLRVYEKGLKILNDKKNKHQDLSEVSPDWARLELEVKPKGAQKVFASKLEPYEFFGHGWAKEIPILLSGENMPKIKLGTVWKPESDLETRLGWMAHQYGKTINDALDQRCGGSIDDLGAYLLEVIQLVKKKDDLEVSQEIKDRVVGDLVPLHLVGGSKV